MKRFKAALVLGALALSAVQAQAQAVDIAGDAKACLGIGCTPVDVFDELVDGVTLRYTSVAGTDFSGIADPTLAINSAVGNFGRLFVGVSDGRTITTPFTLLLSFLLPTTADIPFQAAITGKITTFGNNGIVVDYDELAPEFLNAQNETSPWQNFTTLEGQHGRLRVQALALTVPSGQEGTLIGNLETQVVPEPASMMLLGTGLVGLAGAARRRRQRK